MGAIPETVTLYLSSPYPCPYLSNKTAASLIIDPNLEVDQDMLTFFTLNGFRRSGDIIYKPHCSDCNECISVRISTDHYRANRNQRRVELKNQDLRVKPTQARFEDMHFELYLRYQKARHPESEMCSPDPKQYRRFLVNDRYDSIFYEMYLQDALVAVAVSDRLNDGLSAVYTFFDPDLSHRSLGTYAILHQIQKAKEKQLPFVYLGFWIRDCRKMAYKNQFKPTQGLVEDSWRPVS